MSGYQDALARAAQALSEADALIITAGAGMGVDSGLPDFRGNEGFWNAYPPYRNLNVSFVEMANPAWFDREPSFAWGFYGHRRNLYRATVPHEGFAILLKWGLAMKGGYFVYTSNVDNQFQKAGFDPEKIVECHGSLEWNQCTTYCNGVTCPAGIFRAGPEEITLDVATMKADRLSLPRCPECGSVARPNILMFGDFGWNGAREREQDANMTRWLDSVEGLRIVVVECGAGKAVATVRCFSELTAAGDDRRTLIRLNPRDPEVPYGHISIPLGSLEALRAIDRLMEEK